MGGVTFTHSIKLGIPHMNTRIQYRCKHCGEVDTRSRDCIAVHNSESQLWVVEDVYAHKDTCFECGHEGDDTDWEVLTLPDPVPATPRGWQLIDDDGEQGPPGVEVPATPRAWQTELNELLNSIPKTTYDWQQTTRFQLLARRPSQSDSREEAYEHGSQYVVGEFTNVAEFQVLRQAAEATAQMMDGNEELDLWVEFPGGN